MTCFLHSCATFNECPSNRKQGFIIFFKVLGLKLPFFYLGSGRSSSLLRSSLRKKTTCKQSRVYGKTVRYCISQVTFLHYIGFFLPPNRNSVHIGQQGVTNRSFEKSPNLNNIACTAKPFVIFTPMEHSLPLLVNRGSKNNKIVLINIVHTCI